MDSYIFINFAGYFSRKGAKSQTYISRACKQGRKGKQLKKRYPEV